MVFTDYLGRDLVQMILTNVLYFQVHLGELSLRPIPVLAPFFLLAETALYHLEPPSQSPVRLDVLVHLAVAAHRQLFDPQVHADFGINCWQLWNVPLNGNRDVVLTRFVPADGAELDLTLYFSVLDRPDALKELRDDQLVLDHLDVLWYTEGLMTVLRLEDRELATTGEEVVVRSVQTLERELQGLRVHFLHPRQGLLQLGQVLAVAVIVGRLLAVEILALACGEEVVVDVPDRSEVLAEKHSLFLVRVQPEAVRKVMPVRHLALFSRLASVFGRKTNFFSLPGIDQSQPDR